MKNDYETTLGGSNTIKFKIDPRSVHQNPLPGDHT